MFRCGHPSTGYNALEYNAGRNHKGIHRGRQIRCRKCYNAMRHRYMKRKRYWKNIAEVIYTYCKLVEAQKQAEYLAERRAKDAQELDPQLTFSIAA